MVSIPNYVPLPFLSLLVVLWMLWQMVAQLQLNLSILKCSLSVIFSINQSIHSYTDNFIQHFSTLLFRRGSQQESNNTREEAMENLNSGSVPFLNGVWKAWQTPMPQNSIPLSINYNPHDHIF